MLALDEAPVVHHVQDVAGDALVNRAGVRISDAEIMQAPATGLLSHDRTRSFADQRDPLVMLPLYFVVGLGAQQRSAGRRRVCVAIAA